MQHYKKVKYGEITSFRKRYFEELSGLQELFVEWIVAKSYYYTINNEGGTIGYFIVSKQNSLVKLYVDMKNIPEITEIFKDIYSKFNIQNVLCKSFDAALLKCCFSSNLEYKPAGHLFRDCIDTAPQDISVFTKIEFAAETDYDNLVKYDNELYDTEEELRYMLKNKMILKYYIEDQLTGCGFLIKATEFDNHCDIGMWVDTPYRNQGFGAKIISDLKQRCLKNGVEITCGCAAENTASKKALEKNGFRTKHDLIICGNGMPFYRPSLQL